VPGLKAAAIDLLMALHAHGVVGARRAPLDMHDRRGGLEEHLVAETSEPEAVVGVFVVARREVGIEPTQACKQISRRRQECARHVVHPPDVVEERPRWIGMLAAEVTGGGVGEDDAAGLLEPAVGKQEFAADRPRPGKLPEGVDQRGQPAGERHRVVVEKHEIVAGGGCGAAVARAHEAEVLGVAHDDDAVIRFGDRGELCGRLVGGSVVHDDNLDGPVGR